MKVIYNHASIPTNGIQLNTEYELSVKGEKALLTLGNFKLELTKYQAEEMFEEVKQTS